MLPNTLTRVCHVEPCYYQFNGFSSCQYRGEMQGIVETV